MIIKEIIFLSGAYSRKGNGLFCFSPYALRLTPCGREETLCEVVYPLRLTLDA